MPVQQSDARTEIAEIISNRRDQYTCAIVRTAIALDDSGTWRNCLTLVQLSSEQIESRSLIYPSFEIIELAQNPESAVDIVDELLDKGQLSVSGKIVSMDSGHFNILGYGRVGERVTSRSSWVGAVWPGEQYLFSSGRSGRVPREPQVAPNMPLYPDGSTAIEHILGLDMSGYRTWDGGLVFFFPDYRARIHYGTAQARGIYIEVEPKCADLGDLTAKVYAVSDEGTLDQRDLEILEREINVDIGFRPARANVCLLFKQDGQLLDYWNYPASLWSRTSIEAPVTPEDVRQVVTQGENEHIEFKPGTRDDAAKKEIAESAIAFANREGGIILLGVDDNGGVVGAYGGEWEEIIRQSLRDRCDPPIDPRVTNSTIDDKPVYVIQIPESERKPHMMRANGVIYVRVGATDRPAMRSELEDFFRSDSHFGGLFR